MRSAVVGLLALASLIMLAGCGGGGGGESAQGNIATLLVYSDDAYTVPTDALWAAFQDGVNGPWVPVTKTATGVYQATVTNADKAFGFAVVNRVGNVFVVQSTLADGAAVPIWINQPAANVSRLRSPGARMAVRSAARTSGDFAISGTFAGVPSNGSVVVFDGILNNHYPFAEGEFCYYSPVTGRQDFAAMLFTEKMPTALYLYRCLNLPLAGIDLGIIDFSAIGTGVYALQPCRVMPVTNAVSVDNWMYYVTRGNTVINIENYDDNTYATLPGAAQVLGDRYVFDIGKSVDTNNYLETVCARATPPTSMTLPAPFTPNCTAADGGITAGGLNYAFATGYIMGVHAGQSTWNVQLSAAWLRANAGATSYTLPTFDGVAGWNTNWNYNAGQLASFSCQAIICSNASLADAINLVNCWDYAILPTDSSISYALSSIYF